MCVFGFSARPIPTIVEQLCSGRMAFLVNDSSSYLDVKYLSEPMLVHGAHRILQDFPNRWFL